MKSVIYMSRENLHAGFATQLSPLLPSSETQLPTAARMKAELHFMLHPFCVCSLYLVVFITMKGAADRQVSGLGAGRLGCSGARLCTTG